MRKPSVQTRQVFQAFLDAPSEETYGFELAKVTGLATGSIYPILRRLEEQKFIVAREEVIDANAPRPRIRVWYRLTAEGRRVAQRVTVEQRDALRILSPGWST